MATVGLAAFSCTFPDYRFEPVAPDTCDNDILDNGETRVDCGGSCDPCPCIEDDECPGTDQICDDGLCRGECDNGECPPPISCDDEKQNGDETDTDCGGSCDADCAVDQGCKSGEDCIERVCEDEVCQDATCDDGVQNGSEASKDCGRNCPDKCANGEPCMGNVDCEENTCIELECVDPLCDNDRVDVGETGEDCGGNQCPPCDVGFGCETGSDCVTGACDENDKCANPSCDDDVANGDESDVDCGGMDCPDCDDNEKCRSDDDCKSKICNDEDKCQEDSCEDGVTNGEESDRDCGGNCPGCLVGDRCYEDGDCELEICDRDGEAAIGECVSCDDGERNGSELGLDCGGSDCELCQPGDPCTDDAGCVNYLCNDEERCDVGLTLDYQCGQCGATTLDHVKFFVTLHNLSERPIDVRDVTLRYYFDVDLDDATLQRFVLECEYEGSAICGSQSLNAYPTPTDGATHYFETILGLTESIAVGGSAEMILTMRIPAAQPPIELNQRDDYSFADPGGTSYPQITLHRRDALIWGTEP